MSRRPSPASSRTRGDRSPVLPPYPPAHRTAPEPTYVLPRLSCDSEPTRAAHRSPPVPTTLRQKPGRQSRRPGRSVLARRNPPEALCFHQHCVSAFRAPAHIRTRDRLAVELRRNRLGRDGDHMVVTPGKVLLQTRTVRRPDAVEAGSSIVAAVAGHRRVPTGERPAARVPDAAPTPLVRPHRFHIAPPEDPEYF